MNWKLWFCCILTKTLLLIWVMKHKVHVINVLSAVYFAQKVLKNISPTQFHVFLLKTEWVKMESTFDGQDIPHICLYSSTWHWESDVIHWIILMSLSTRESKLFSAIRNDSYEPVLCSELKLTSCVPNDALYTHTLLYTYALRAHSCSVYIL